MSEPRICADCGRVIGPLDWPRQPDAERARQADPVGLRDLFARYIVSHGEPAEWSDDGGWCLKHLPTIAEVQAALASIPAQAVEPGPLDVERLARAMTGDGADDPPLFDLLGPASKAQAMRRATELAERYAALSPDKQPKGAG